MRRSYWEGWAPPAVPPPAPLPSASSDEGHVFQRPESLLAFDAIMETFLAQCLGGSYQPVGDDFKGANLAVPIGADKVYGLADALKT